MHIHAAIAQQKKGEQSAPYDIFGDLPFDNPARLSVLQPGEKPEEKIRSNIFATATLSKTTCYAGEPVLLSVELLSGLQSTSRVQRLPAFTGFQVIDMETPENDYPRSETKKGRKFSLFTVRKFQLIPVREGTLEIGSLVLDNEVSYTEGNQKHRYSGLVSSNPLLLHVQPLPEVGKPVQFAGAVGSFQLRAFLQRDSVPAGENNSLEIEISGSGNFFSLPLPLVSWPAGFHAFDPEEKLRVDERVFPAKGTKSILFPFIVGREGAYTIPPIEYGCFDAVAKRYRIARTAAMNIFVEASLVRPRPPGPVPPVQDSKFYPWYLYLLGGLLIILLPVLFAARKLFAKKREEKYTAPVQQPEETKQEEAATAKILADIAWLETLEGTPNYIIQFKEVLVHYLAHRFPVPDASTTDLVRQVQEKEPALGDQLQKLLNDCDMWLYASVTPGPAARKELVEQLRALVEKIDR